jgi:hypothetical protein
MNPRYNPNSDGKAFKSFRTTLSNPVLVQAVEQVQVDTGMSEREIARESIIQYLEEKEQIKLE